MVEDEAYIFLQQMVGQIYHLENGVGHKTSLRTTLEQLKKPRKYQSCISVLIQYVYVRVIH